MLNDLIKTKKTKEMHQCDHCNEYFTEENFYTIYGNICIGTGGGLVGNNFEMDNENGTGQQKSNTLAKASIFCKPCLKEILKMNGRDSILTRDITPNNDTDGYMESHMPPAIKAHRISDHGRVSNDRKSFLPDRDE